MNIASSLNDKYAPYTYVMLSSLFKNNSDSKIDVYLLEADLSEESKRRFKELSDEYGNTVHFVKMDREAFGEKLPFVDWPMETAFRLAMNDTLPQGLDRILYLDGDMIVNKSISDLYYRPFDDGCHLIVTHDMTMTPDSLDVYGDLHTEIFNRMIRDNKYFNAGMILMDFAYLRERYSFADYMNLAESIDYEIFAPDQDLLNLMHEDETEFVDALKYDLFACNAMVNGLDYEAVKHDVSIIHYVGDKPWRGGSHFHYEVEQLWWDYALDTVYPGQLIMDFVETHFGNSDFYDAIRKAEEFNENLKRDIRSAVLAFKKMYELVYKKTDDIFTDEMSFSDSVKHIDIPIGEREMDHGEAFVRAVISDRSVEDYVGKLREENEALNRQLEMALKAYEALRKMVQ